MDNKFETTNNDALDLYHFCNIVSILDTKGDVIEFGTCMGRSAIALARANSNRLIYTIDHFRGLEKTKQPIPESCIWREGTFAIGDTENGVTSDINEILDSLKQYKNIIQINCDIHELKTPEDYGILNNIVACHIDVDIYEPTVSSLKFLDMCKWNEVFIRFDDWSGHIPDYDNHERLAFKEWVDINNYQYTILFGGGASGIIVNR